MDNWTISTDRPGYRCKTLQHGNCTIEIYRPIVTEAEAAKNEETARKALESALRSIYTRQASEGRIANGVC